MAPKEADTSKVDELPEDIRIKVDFLLADTKNSYEDISQFLKEQGYIVSKSSVGRYALRSNTALQRLMEAQVQTTSWWRQSEKNRMLITRKRQSC